MSIRTPHKLHGYKAKPSYSRKNKGCIKPWTGERECERRKRQIAAGQLKVG